jgi:hypothetical protein
MFPDYHRRVEAARMEYLLLLSQEQPNKASSGQGEVKMTEGYTDLVHKQLWELTQHIVHVMKECNNEMEVLEDENDSVRNGILIMECQLHTE